MSYIPDYNDLASREDEKRCRYEDRLPKCDYCGEPIHDDYLYDINGEIICEECLKENFRRKVEDYMK